MTVTFAIVGRPNVGKSTLFNRLIGRQHAIVDDQPGVTRDRREGQGYLASLAFTVIDTAGLEEADDGSLEARMRRQTEMAVRDADITLMVVDAKAGVTPVDKFFASEIRKSGASQCQFQQRMARDLSICMTPYWRQRRPSGLAMF
jgi:GTPase